MEKGNPRHSEWNLQGFSPRWCWSSIFISLWPVADAYWTCSTMYSSLFAVHVLGMPVLNYSACKFSSQFFLLLFLFGSYSTGRLWYKSLRTGKQWHKLHVIYLLFKDHHLIFIILSPLFLTYFVIFVIYGFRQLPSYLLQLFSAKRTRKPTILCDGKSNQDQNLHWKEETCYGTDLWW